MAHKLILEYVLKLKKIFNFISFHYKTILAVKQNILLKPVSVSKILMSVSSNIIGRFLNFALKIMKQKVYSNLYMR